MNILIKKSFSNMHITFKCKTIFNKHKTSTCKF